MKWKTYLLLIFAFFKIIIFQDSFVCSQDLAMSNKILEDSNSHKLKSLKVVLNGLEKKFKVYFSYDESLIKGKFIDSNSIISDNLEESITNVLKPLGLSYEKVNEKYYGIFSVNDRKQKQEGRKKSLKKEESNLRQGELGETSLNPSLSNIFLSLTGAVIDETGQPIPGVNILEKGTTNGTSTDVNGTYKITVSNESSVLVYSFIGYSTIEKNVGNSTILNMTLISDIKTLSEVVVVGYGTQEKKDLTSSISSVKSEDISKIVNLSADQALQGRAAGVFVSGGSGGTSVQIRGAGTVGSSEPLYVIDGVPINYTSLNSSANGVNQVNPNDIESMEVLKDASAAAIYGSRAANGVVIITTKRGKSGKPKIEFDAYYGTQKAWRQLDLLNAQQFAALSNEINTNGQASLTPAFKNPQSLGKGTDWQKEVFRTSPIQNYNLSFSGGGNNFNYNIAGGYLNQQDIVIGNNNERFTLRINSDVKTGKIFKFGESVSLTRTNNISNGGGSTGLVGAALALPSAIAVRDTNWVGDVSNKVGYGGTDNYGGANVNNPVGSINIFRNSSYSNRFLGNIYGEVELIKGLKYRLNLSGDFIYGGGKNSNPAYYSSSYDQKLISTTGRGSNTTTNLIAENLLTYDNTFGKHHITALIGYSAQKTVFDGISASGQDVPYVNGRLVDALEIAAAAKNNLSINGRTDPYTLLSQFGRLNYSFNNKYLLSATIRRDGSSHFGPEHKYGIFPAFSAGWRIIQEDFMQNFSFLSDLKLRASWGTLGNDNLIPYAYYANLDSRTYYLDGTNTHKTRGVAVTSGYNAALKWEATTTGNVGLDVGLFQNKIYLTIDYFKRTTNGILLRPPVPATTGVEPASGPFVNAGTVQNKGLEVALTYRKSFNEFKFEVSGNITSIKNNVIDLGTSPYLVGNNSRTVVGKPIGSFYVYQTDGIFQNQAEIDTKNSTVDNKGNKIQFQPNAQPGDIRFKDIGSKDANGKPIPGVSDGKIDDADRYYAGSPIPTLYYGLTLNGSYKGFDLYVFLQGVSGNKIYNATRSGIEDMKRGAYNQSASTLNRWVGPGTSNSIPRAVQGDPNQNTRPSDRWLEDGKYTRIKNIQVGYNIPKKWLDLTHSIASFRVYIAVQNAFTFTKYSGYDPEVTAFSGANVLVQNTDNLSRGVDGGPNLPQSRTFLVGLHLGF